MTITKPSKTNSFTAGTITKSSQVNTNFDDVFDVFEEDAYLAKGWFAVDNASFEYNSANSIKTTSDIDVTGLIQVGDKITFEQATDGEKFFFITAIDYNSTVANRTYIELYGGTDYDVDNEAITADTVGFSRLKAPFGFPLNPDKWTIEYSDASDRTQSSPTINVWYNINSASIAVPAGVWHVMYEVQAVVTGSVPDGESVFTTLSKSSSSEDDNAFTARTQGQNAYNIISLHTRAKTINLSASATLYLLTMNNEGTATSIRNHGNDGTTIIRATIAYL